MMPQYAQRPSVSGVTNRWPITQNAKRITERSKTMSLNFSTGSGSFTPYLRYMASTSSWQMSGDGGSENVQLSQAVFDLENIKTGWCQLMEGMPPTWVMDASLEQSAPKPEGENWKRGFKVDVYSKSLFGEQSVREWATNSTGATMSIGALYDEYLKVKDDGKLPVVEYQGAVPTKVGKGSTTVPTLKILKMIDRPQELVKDTAPSISSVAAQTVVEDAEF